jgi:hypothetical protein
MVGSVGGKPGVGTAGTTSDAGFSEMYEGLVAGSRLLPA